MQKKDKIIKILVFILVGYMGLKYGGLICVSKSINKINNLHSVIKYNSELFEIEGNKLINQNKVISAVNLYGLSNGYVHFNDHMQGKVEMFYNGFCYRKDYNDKQIKAYFGSCYRRINNYKTVGHEQVFMVKKSGKYKVELWGAAGGKQAFPDDLNPKMQLVINKNNGRGAYTSGILNLKIGDIIYVYVGSKGEDGVYLRDTDRLTSFGYPSRGGIGGYNGGGDGFDDPEFQGAGGGGGATDIRLIGGKSNDFNSLKSRIMVAGAGGGMSRYYYLNGKYYEGSGASGSGGTLKGKNGRVYIKNDAMYGYGATQNTGYKFGIGEHGSMCMTTINGLGGGAGGYYGSRSGMCNIAAWVPSNGAGGGSSYVSGCKGCKSIEQNSTEKKVKFTPSEVHYSNIKFSKIKMTSGDEKMPNPLNGELTIGNNSDGYARITFEGY